MNAVLLALISVLAASTVQGQTATIIAFVTDSIGNPLADADVGIKGTSIRRYTDKSGRATLGLLPIGRTILRIRRVGYIEQSSDITLLPGTAFEGHYKLIAAPATLAKIVVKASELKPDRYAGTTRFDAFYRRRAQGQGTFLTREMIDARNAQKSEDLLRMVTGVRIRYRGSTPFIQFLRCDNVNVYIDGIRSHDAFRDYFALSPLDIEAMEVYHGIATVPPEFSPEPNDCAAIVVWTRWM